MFSSPPVLNLKSRYKELRNRILQNTKLSFLYLLHHWSLSSAKRMQSTSYHPTFERITIIQLCLGLISSHFLWVFPPKPCVLLFTSMPCMSHPYLFHLTTLIYGEEYKSWRSSYNFLHLPVTSSLLGPKSLPSTLFWMPLAYILTSEANDQCQ